MRKSDVQYRRRGYTGHATVCIKVPWVPMGQAIRQASENEPGEIPDGLTEDWVDENVSEDTLSDIWWMVAANEYEYFEDWAAEIMPGTTFEQEGRQGGWAVSNWTEDDVEGWDAVQLAKWAKIVRVARAIAEGVNEQVVYSLAANEWPAYLEREEDRRSDWVDVVPA